MNTRRKFISMVLFAFAVVSSGLGFIGCSAVTDLENWIPVALTSLSAIVKLLGPIVPPEVSAIIAIITAGFSALLTALKNYQSGNGVLTDVTNAVAAIESAFQNFFASLGVPSALLNTIEGLASILLSTLQAFANEISPNPTLSASVGGRNVSYTPQKRSVSRYKRDWNTECVSMGHPEAQI